VFDRTHEEWKDERIKNENNKEPLEEQGMETIKLHYFKISNTLQGPARSLVEAGAELLTVSARHSLPFHIPMRRSFSGELPVFSDKKSRKLSSV
jgi:hypothetical protein